MPIDIASLLSGGAPIARCPEIPAPSVCGISPASILRLKITSEVAGDVLSIRESCGLAKVPNPTAQHPDGYLLEVCLLSSVRTVRGTQTSIESNVASSSTCEVVPEPAFALALLLGCLILVALTKKSLGR